MKLNLNDLNIDVKSLGSDMLLTDVRPTYDYSNGKRSEKVIGYSYTVALVAHKFADLSVKIAGEQQIELTSDAMPVRFEGLLVRAYKSFRDGEVYYSAVADKIMPVKGDKS